jgi:hypothetical protein
MYRLIQEGTNRYGQFDQQRLTREQQERLAKLEDATRRYAADRGAESGETQARIGAGASMYGASMANTRAETERNTAAYSAAREDIAEGGPLYAPYLAARRAGRGDEYFNDRVKFYSGTPSGGGGGGGGGGSATVDLGSY